MYNTNEERDKVSLDKKIGAIITKEREARGLTRNELAELMELSSSHVNMIERGLRGATAMSFKKLSEIFKVPVDHFFTLTRPAADATPDERTQKVRKLECIISDLSLAEVNFIIDVVSCMSRLQENPQASHTS